MEIFWLILLIFNILVYGACCFILLRRKSFTSISIRSPNLLILNNIGNLLISIIIILKKLIYSEAGQKYSSMFYYSAYLLMMLSFIARFGRLIKCSEIKKDEREDLQEIYNKNYLFQEKYYIKTVAIFFILLTVILIIFDAIKKFNYIITINFLYNSDSSFDKNVLSVTWQAISFSQLIILLTFAYKLCVNKIKQKIRFEIISMFLICFLYSNAVTIFEFFQYKINYVDFMIYLTLAVCYSFLILNTILPILISFSYRYSTVYHFTPKLMSNMYLFLSNESCYKEFNDYLNTINGNGNRYLEIYTKIMNFKLGFVLKVNNEIGFLEAREISDLYFSNANMDGLFPNEIMNNIKNECNNLNNNQFTEGMFDEALKHCYNELGKDFNNFKKTDKFKDLYDEFYYTSYIQCKMCNAGLINKF